MSTKQIVVIVIILAVVIGGLFLIPNDASSKYDGFAECLKDKGAQFYGAFWCPHCAEQKKLFGRAQKYLPYIECSTPDSKGQLQVCTDKGVKSYPTWFFADGTRIDGKASLETLAEKTMCELPQ